MIRFGPLTDSPQALQALRHPNIIDMLRVIRQDAVLYLVYEYMDCSLLDYLNQVALCDRSTTDIRNIT